MKLPLLLGLACFALTRCLATSITLDPSSGGTSFHGTIDLGGSGPGSLNLPVSNSVFPYNGTLSVGSFSVLHETPTERYFLLPMGWNNALLGLFGSGSFADVVPGVAQSVYSYANGTGQSQIDGHVNEFVSFVANWAVPVTWTGFEFTGVGTWSIELTRQGPALHVPNSGSTLMLVSLAIAGIATARVTRRHPQKRPELKA